MNEIYLVVSALYSVMMLFLICGWNRGENNLNIKFLAHRPLVSIVVVFRNEARSIVRLLQSISKQTYGYANLEIILINDSSTDHSVPLIWEFQRESQVKIRLVDLQQIAGYKSHKKNGITQAVQLAEGKYIFCTDGDCALGEKVIESLMRLFIEDNLAFLSGPVKFFYKPDLRSKIMALEFSSLVGSAGACIKLGIPNMCNGASMLFKKEVFNMLNGYDGVESEISGDDEFLMKKIQKILPSRVSFAFDTESVVETNPPLSWKEFLHQRRRWASKWSKHKDKSTGFLAVWIFTFNLLLLLAPIFAYMGKLNFTVLAIVLVIRWIFDWIFLSKIARMLRQPIRLGVFMLTEFLYPIYAVFFGLLANFGSYEWKYREHKL